MTQAYFKGTHENAGFGCAAKHFPGDGIDERDQHLSPVLTARTAIPGWPLTEKCTKA